MANYPIAKKIRENASIHCAALLISPNFNMGRSSITLETPRAAHRNGTITFVRSCGRTYAITCDHVVKAFRAADEEEKGSYLMKTMLHGMYSVVDRFEQPFAQFGQRRADIAISEVKRAFVSHLGKEEIDLDALPKPPADITHGYAVGFAEGIKFERSAKDGYFLVTPHVEVLAEYRGRLLTDPFSLYSQMELDPTLEYSGMSGGPVFWSTEGEYGIFGIIYEGGRALDGIKIFAEAATPDIIKGWIKDYHSQKQRP